MNTFNDLVSWATWYIIEGLLRGESLRSLIHHVIAIAREWKLSDHEGVK